MQRDKRVQDNWALIHAQDLALKNKVPLYVCFTYLGKFENANIRQYQFLFDGLKETSEKLNDKNIPFYLLNGDPVNEISKFIEINNIGSLVTDFSPLKVYQNRVEKIASKISIQFQQVDAHNIIPTWIASEKQEYAAYTFRPKVLKKIDEYLTDFPEIINHPIKPSIKLKSINWEDVINNLEIDLSIPKIDWLNSGENAAEVILNKFINESYHNYGDDKNNPNLDGTSNFSPYLHYGHISSQRIALLLYANEAIESKGFLEQLIVRRELADNFCYFNKSYDSYDGFPNWAKKSLDSHRNDEREYLYSISELEEANIHDDLWNAAQKQMTKTGKMHTYMRMYWAKKILEWSPTPEDALQNAIDLNDKYELDGRDPNGYTGIAWSIGGVHDRPWFDRSIFGQVRYMSYGGCKNKFDINSYINSNT
jgi:deoxyribodipyrimidine photo-lyase